MSITVHTITWRLPEPSKELRDLVALVHERESERLIRSVCGLDALPRDRQEDDRGE